MLRRVAHEKRQLTKRHLRLAGIPNPHHLLSTSTLHGKRNYRRLLLSPRPGRKPTSRTRRRVKGWVDRASKIHPAGESDFRSRREVEIAGDHLFGRKDETESAKSKRGEGRKGEGRVRLTMEQNESCEACSRHFHTDDIPDGSSSSFPFPPFMTSGRPRRARRRDWSGGASSESSKSEVNMVLI